MSFKTQKITQMTPKGSDLAATDLVEVSTLVSGSYVTRSITGQEIIDAATSAGVTSVGATAPIASSGGTTPTISIATADTSTTGALTSTDWNTFNGKQAALVSGTNIKTIEGQSLLGSGNIDLTKSDVGLGNVDNTSDANKPVSTATQTALNAKQDTLVSGTNIKTVNSTSLLGSGDISVQNPITLTTTGTSGAATLVGSTLNIPQYSGGGTSNPKAIAVVVADGTGITSTTPSISRSVLISANTLDTNCVLEVVWGSVRLVGASGTGQSALYVNTSNTLTGATLVAIGANMTTTQNYVKCARDIQKIGTAAKTSNATQIASDYTLTGSVNSFTLNNSTDLYFLFTQSGGASDTMTIRNVRITQYS